MQITNFHKSFSKDETKSTLNVPKEKRNSNVLPKQKNNIKSAPCKAKSATKSPSANKPACTPEMASRLKQKQVILNDQLRSSSIPQLRVMPTIKRKVPEINLVIPDNKINTKKQKLSKNTQNNSISTRSTLPKKNSSLQDTKKSSKTATPTSKSSPPISVSLLESSSESSSSESESDSSISSSSSDSSDSDLSDSSDSSFTSCKSDSKVITASSGLNISNKPYAHPSKNNFPRNNTRSNFSRTPLRNNHSSTPVTSQSQKGTKPITSVAPSIAPTGMKMKDSCKTRMSSNSPQFSFSWPPDEMECSQQKSSDEGLKPRIQTVDSDSKTLRQNGYSGLQKRKSFWQTPKPKQQFSDVESSTSSTASEFKSELSKLLKKSLNQISEFTNSLNSFHNKKTPFTEKSNRIMADKVKTSPTTSGSTSFVKISDESLQSKKSAFVPSHDQSKSFLPNKNPTENNTVVDDLIIKIEDDARVNSRPFVYIAENVKPKPVSSFYSSIDRKDFPIDKENKIQNLIKISPIHSVSEKRSGDKDEHITDNNVNNVSDIPHSSVTGEKEIKDKITNTTLFNQRYFSRTDNSKDHETTI